MTQVTTVDMGSRIGLNVKLKVEPRILLWFVYYGGTKHDIITKTVSLAIIAGTV